MKVRKWLAVGASVFMAMTLSFGFAACSNGNGGGGGNADHEHTFSEVYSKNENQHWQKCTHEGCTAEQNRGNHVDANSDGTCDVCEYVLGSRVVEYSDWYIVGSGYGTLNSASWDYFLEDFRLEKTDEENKFIIHDVTLYEGDNFKVIKRNPGDEAFFGPDEDRADFWLNHLNGGSGELDNQAGTLKEGSLKNILTSAGGDGVYDIWVIEESAVMFTVYYELKQPLEPLSDAAKYECYVVGNIASKSTCCWPGSLPEGRTLAECCFTMTLQEDGKTFKSEPIRLTTADRFKVFNAKDNKYHPDGVNNDQKVTSDGLYTISWDTTGDSLKIEKVSG